MNIFLLKLASILCLIQILVQLCKCDLSDIEEDQLIRKSYKGLDLYEDYLPTPQSRSATGYGRARVYEDEKDINLKKKIALLLNQTMLDTKKRIKKTDEIKENHREEYPYKVGFVLCMIRKAKNVMDELFNVAAKHKDQWKSLQHLKVFELIVHTNVDTTNLLRQLVDIHLKHTNATREKKKRSLL